MIKFILPPTAAACGSTMAAGFTCRTMPARTRVRWSMSAALCVCALVVRSIEPLDCRCERTSSAPQTPATSSGATLQGYAVWIRYKSSIQPMQALAARSQASPSSSCAQTSAVSKPLTTVHAYLSRGPSHAMVTANRDHATAPPAGQCYHVTPTRHSSTVPSSLLVNVIGPSDSWMPCPTRKRRYTPRAWPCTYRRKTGTLCHM